MRSTSSRASSICTLVLLLVASTAVGFAQELKLSPEKKAKLESQISIFMTTNHVPGVSVAVVENGEHEWTQGFGMADLENFVPATSKTLYRLASISKPLTAVAAMQLWEKGKLDLEAPVQRYCPEFPQKPWPVTTREVMAHLGGIRHYRAESQNDLEGGNTIHFDNTIAAGLKFFKDDPLVAQPGTKFKYSTQGYTLVGCVIEGASSAKYVEYLRAHVFSGAGMVQTQADDRLAIIPYRTRFYRKDVDGRVVNADPLDSSYKIPGGGWLSSAEDMAQFEVAMLNDKLVHRSTRDAMWTPQRLSDGSMSDYALGWGTKKDDGVATVGHGGGQQGTSTFILLAPDQRAGIVILANMEALDVSALAHAMLKILLSKP